MVKKTRPGAPEQELIAAPFEDKTGLGGFLPGEIPGTLIYAIYVLRAHQGKENRILFPLQTREARRKEGAVRCRERLGGLLKYYERKAA